MKTPTSRQVLASLNTLTARLFILVTLGEIRGRDVNKVRPVPG